MTALVQDPLQRYLGENLTYYISVTFLVKIFGMLCPSAFNIVCIIYIQNYDCNAPEITQLSIRFLNRLKTLIKLENKQESMGIAALSISYTHPVTFHGGFYHLYKRK